MYDFGLEDFSILDFNDRMDEIIKKLEDMKGYEFGFYYENLEFLTDLCFKFYNTFKDLPLKEPETCFVPNIDENLISQLLQKVSKRAYDKYLELKSKNLIEVVNKSESRIDDVSRFSSTSGKLTYAFKNDYDYLVTLLHELMHATNISVGEPYLGPSVLTEAISIIKETEAKENLSTLGIDEKYIDFHSRIKWSLNYLYDASILLIPFLIKSRHRFIDVDGYIIKEIDREKHYLDDISQYKFSSTCKDLDKKLNYRKKSTSISEKIYDTLYGNNRSLTIQELCEVLYATPKYIFSTCLAFYAREYLNKEDVDKLNEELINNPNIDPYKLLKKYGIELNNEFIEKSMNAVMNYYEMYNKQNELHM